MFDWLFGSGRQTSYDDTLKQAQQASKAQADATAYYYDNIDKGWDSMDSNARADALNQYNQLNNSATSAGENYSNYFDAYNQEEKDNRYNYFGNGLLGALLNPIGQTVSAGKDLATGQYQENDRDVMSDLGAAGQTALSFLPFAGGLARAGGAVGKIGAGVGKAANSIPGMAGVSAGFNVGENIRQNGAETDLSQLPGEALSGAAFGAAIPIVGRAGGKFLKNRGAKQVAEKFMTDPRNAKASAQLQEAGGGAVNSLIRDIAGRERNNLAQRYGGLYQNALSSMVPRSTAGKLALGGGAIYGGSRLLGMGAEQDPTQQLATEFVQMYGREPSEYELQLLTAGGY